MIAVHAIFRQGRNSVSKPGGRRPPISQDLEAGGRNMFVRMDLALKYSQKRNFFIFLSKKNKIFKSSAVDAPHASPRSYAPVFRCLPQIVF